MSNEILQVIRVKVSAPGFTAEQIEHEITTPIERELCSAAELKSVLSSSQEGLSTVELTFGRQPNSRDEAAITEAVSRFLTQTRPGPVVQSISMEVSVLR